MQYLTLLQGGCPPTPTPDPSGLGIVVSASPSDATILPLVAVICVILLAALGLSIVNEQWRKRL